MAALKPTLAALGLRTRSKKDTITGKRIPGSSSNKFLQAIGLENKEDAENTIREAEKASSKKKGLIFVFNLLLETLKELKKIRVLGDNVEPSRWPELIKQVKILKKKEDKLLYIIANSSFLVNDDASQYMRNLLEENKERKRQAPESSISWTFNNLDSKIREVEKYKTIFKNKVENKVKTRDRRMLRSVLKHKTPQNLDPTIAPYESGTGSTGPFSHIGSFLPDTHEHMQKTIDERERVAGEKFRDEYHKRRRKDAIRRDIALGRTTEEEAVNFPEDYGKALNSGGRRSRIRKKSRRRRRKRTRNKRSRKSKKKRRTRKRRRSRKRRR